VSGGNGGEIFDRLYADATAGAAGREVHRNSLRAASLETETLTFQPDLSHAFAHAPHAPAPAAAASSSGGGRAPPVHERPYAEAADASRHRAERRSR